LSRRHGIEFLSAQANPILLHGGDTRPFCSFFTISIKSSIFCVDASCPVRQTNTREPSAEGQKRNRHPRDRQVSRSSGSLGSGAEFGPWRLPRGPWQRPPYFPTPYAQTQSPPAARTALRLPLPPAPSGPFACSVASAGSTLVGRGLAAMSDARLSALPRLTGLNPRREDA
jgi:hypothetical protein